jgi:hypothetical protein
MEAQLFAATPPLEALKTQISRFMGRKLSKRGKTRKMVFIDIKKAHLFSKVTREIFIELPWEDKEEGKIGVLDYCLYGTRDAAANFEATYTQVLTTDDVFRQGLASPSLFCSESLDMELLVHGDDFAAVGDDDAIEALVKMLRGVFELKVRAILGPEPGDDREVRVLNRIIRYVSDERGERIEYEADPRHAELIVAQLGLAGAKSVTTPGTKLKAEEALAKSPALGPSETRLYRSVTMRAQYLSSERGDLQFVVGEKCRRRFSRSQSRRLSVDYRVCVCAVF